MHLLLLTMLVFLVVSGGLLIVVLRVARLIFNPAQPVLPVKMTFFSPPNFEMQSAFSASHPMPIAFTTRQKTAVVVGAIIFHLLFWKQIQGLNLLLWYAGCAGFILERVDT